MDTNNNLDHENFCRAITDQISDPDNNNDYPIYCGEVATHAIVNTQTNALETMACQSHVQPYYITPEYFDIITLPSVN